MKKLELTSMKASTFSPSEKTRTKKERIVRFRILIVSEGTKTEKNYFESFPKFNVNTKAVDVVCKGTATNTIQVVKEARKLEKKEKDSPYDMVWVVFDRDSFEDHKFDTAIELSHNWGYGCAWSNEAFELWYVLHFEDRQTAMSRTEYEKCITNHVKKHIPGYRYRKNDKNTYQILKQYGSQKDAIRRASKMIDFLAGTAPHECNPATTVYELVELLNGNNAEFNKRLEAKLRAGTK